MAFFPGVGGSAIQIQRQRESQRLRQPAGSLPTREATNPHTSTVFLHMVVSLSDC